jgi:glutathione synthase/RimK-type ligase-like ATP-grasp enzyme
MILIISFEHNEHVERVLEHVKSDAVVVDQAWFPKTMRLDTRLSDDFESMRLSLPDGRQLVAAQIGAVWNRRIRPYTLDESLVDQTSRLFAWSESNEALLGVWHSIDCFWMNPPAADDVAQRKIRQLQLARQVGLSIPETLVTNDPSVARDFIRLHGPEHLIRKAFRNIPEAPRHTHRLREEDLELIDSVRYAPVTFQKFVPAELDLRVTVVDGEVFAASIKSSADYETDYRAGLGSAKVEPYELPDEVQARLLAHMDGLGLKYGAVDFRVTPEGEHVFLEVNPAGEYLFISQRTNQPIAQAIAACLDRHAAAHDKQLAQ